MWMCQNCSSPTYQLRQSPNRIQFLLNPILKCPTLPEKVNILTAWCKNGIILWSFFLNKKINKRKKLCSGLEPCVVILRVMSPAASSAGFMRWQAHLKLLRLRFIIFIQRSQIHSRFLVSRWFMWKSIHTFLKISWMSVNMTLPGPPQTPPLLQMFSSWWTGRLSEV